MGKTLTTSERRNSNNKYMRLNKARQEKELSQYSTFQSDEVKKERPKEKYRPRSEAEVD